MRWVLPLLIVVVFVAALVASAMPNPKATAAGCPSFCPNLGLDLVGGLRGEYRLEATDQQPITADILAQTRTIIENRVNATGVAEPNVQTAGGDRITIELPGAADADEIRRLVGSTGRLDFIPVPPAYNNAVTDGQPLPAGMPADPIFSGDQIAAARPGTEPNTGRPAVDIELKQRGATVVLISHCPGTIGLADKLLVLREGAVVLFGPRADVMRRLSPGPKLQPVRLA